MNQHEEHPTKVGLPLAMKRTPVRQEVLAMHPVSELKEGWDNTITIPRRTRSQINADNARGLGVA